jgi:hypothetical protein
MRGIMWHLIAEGFCARLLCDKANRHSDSSEQAL